MPKKLRILLVYPNIPMMLVTPLAIALFTWILRKEGHEVVLFDATPYGEGDLSSPQNRVKYLQARNLFSEKNLRLLKATDIGRDFREHLEAFQPDLLLYSFTEDALGRALELLRISNPYRIPTVVGGVLATAAPEWLLSLPEMQMLAVGEGEEVVRDIARRLSRGQDLTTIPNLWVKQPDGTVSRNPLRPYVRLDDYGTDFSLFDESRFVRPMGGKIHRALPLETYRGCPNRCTYCNSPMHNRMARSLGRVYLRRKSLAAVRRDLAILVEGYHINLLYIVDDDFLARPRRELEDFIQMYQEFRIPFWFNTRPEHCSREMLAKLQEVGLFRCSFGLESGHEDFRRRRLGRNISNANLLRAFETIAQSGVQYSINCIIGFPFETRDMVFDTIRLAKKIKGYDALTVSIFTPYRGTVLREQAIAAGWLEPEALTVHTTATSMLQMPHFTSQEIDGLMRTFPLYVEFDESHWPEIAQAEGFHQQGEEVFRRYSERYVARRWGGPDSEAAAQTNI